MPRTESHRNSSRLIYVYVTVVVTALGLSFGYGVAVGLYHWPPFSALRNAKGKLFGSRTEAASNDYRGEKEILQFAFTDPLVPGERVRPPITSLDGIYEANRSLMLPADQFFEAYDHLKTIAAARLDLDYGATQVLNVSYELAGTQYDAYAYAVDGPRSSQAAALIIPGSGLNQSSAIYRNDPANYQFGIIEALGPSLEKFVLIKPNEDCLAFHDGRSKLNEKFVVNWLINRGASYSADYITNSLAITKYLREHYDKVAVAGLSQGGGAVLLNSLQSHPDVAIVASGFSVINDHVSGAGHDQIIIPGLRLKLGVEQVRSRMRELPTMFLFTYGKGEKGNYKIEAHERPTCEYLSALQNVECEIHDYGHIFPKDIIREFLSRKLSATPKAADVYDYKNGNGRIKPH